MGAEKKKRQKTKQRGKRKTLTCPFKVEKNTSLRPKGVSEFGKISRAAFDGITKSPIVVHSGVNHDFPLFYIRRGNKKKASELERARKCK